VLEVKNIKLNYGDKIVLNDVSFKVSQGKTVGIVGKSGAGKSSLLKIISGYVASKAGSVIYNGETKLHVDSLLIPGYEDMSLVHQDFNLDTYHTVEENIRQKVLHLNQKAQTVLINQMVELLDLGGVRNQKAITLSGGEQQRLGLARALSGENDLILLDEPFVHLDIQVKRSVMSYIRQLQELRNLSIVIVSHNGEEIMGMCDQVIYLKNGRIKRKSSPEMFYRSPKSIEEAGHFGWVNSVYIEGKQKLFRPDQFETTKKEGFTKVELEFLYAEFHGHVYHNYFKLRNGKEIILFNFERLSNSSYIYV
jgi:ABC-type multidrug transport system ATPase subunit